MSHRIDPRYSNALIDANVLDRLGGPEDVVVDRILALYQESKLSLLLPHSVKTEIEHSRTPAEVKRRARDLVFTEPVSLTSEEINRHRKVRALVRGNARPGKHDRDAYHMTEAAKYGGYFITRDDRLLNKREQVTGLLGNAFAIVTPTEFLDIYEYFPGQGG